MINRQILLLLLPLVLLASLQCVCAQGYEIQQEKIVTDEERVVRGDKLKAYRILPNVGIPVRVNVKDSITLGTHGYLTPEHRALGVIYTGNSNSPWQSKIFFDREARQQDFIYWSSFQGMQYSPDNVLWYDTRTPFTYVHYHKNMQTVESEELLKGTLSLNLGKKLNLGASFNYANAEGFYNATRSKDASYRVFGSYQSDRYDVWAYVANNYQKMSESAGIADLDQVLNPDKYTDGRVRLNSRDIPTRVPQDMLFNRLRSGHGYLSHRYKLGYTKKLQPKLEQAHQAQGEPKQLAPDLDDRVLSNTTEAQAVASTDSTEFVPVASIGHTLYYNTQSRRFISRQEHDVWSTLFGPPSVLREEKLKDGTTRQFVLPNDTAAITKLSNTLTLSLLENFRPWVKFGLSTYIRTENTWVSIPEPSRGVYRNAEKFFSSFIGAQASRHTGRGLNFDFSAELGLLGRDLGAFSLDGRIESAFSLWERDFGITLDGKLYNTRPAYFTEHHHGTFGWWDEDFNFSRHFELGARINLSSWGSWAELRTSSLQNHIYWGRDARPHQSAQIIQIAMLRLGHKYRWGALNWDLEAAYQLSSLQDILPLPSLTARADLYFDVLLFKVLGIQLGTEAYWNTAYYAPYYHPTHQQFVLQNEQKIGGKAPLLNAYANFRLKGIRFYLRMFNLGEALMKNDRLSAHLYPYNPMHLQAGISVDLDN